LGRLSWANAVACERLPVEIKNLPVLCSCQAAKPPLTWARAVTHSGATTWALA